MNLLPGPPGAAADAVLEAATAATQHGGLLAVSVHWGPNWGYAVDSSQVQFAHRLIDGGISLIHGHSSLPYSADLAVLRGGDRAAGL